MTWNYRMVRELHEPSQTYSFSIRDVYYDESGTPHSWGADPQHPIGETEEELNHDMELMSMALGKPPLQITSDQRIIDL